MKESQSRAKVGLAKASRGKGRANRVMLNRVREKENRDRGSQVSRAPVRRRMGRRIPLPSSCRMPRKPCKTRRSGPCQTSFLPVNSTLKAVRRPAIREGRAILLNLMGRILMPLVAKAKVECGGNCRMNLTATSVMQAKKYSIMSILNSYAATAVTSLGPLTRMPTENPTRPNRQLRDESPCTVCNAESKCLILNTLPTF